MNLATVIIATESREREFCLCLISLLQQNFKYFEIIVVDGSKEGYSNKYAILFSKISNIKIKVIRINKKNLPLARNKGLENTNTSYACFIDDDAIASKNWLSKILEHFHKEKKSILVGGMAKSINQKNLISKFGELSFFMGFLKKEVKYLPGINFAINLDRYSVLEKKSVIKRESIFLETNFLAGDDTEFCLFVSLILNGKIFYDPAIKVQHRFRESVIDLAKRQFTFGIGDILGLKNDINLTMVKFLNEYLTQNFYIYFFQQDDRSYRMRKKYFIHFLVYIIFKIISDVYAFCKKYGLKWLWPSFIKESSYGLGFLFGAFNYYWLKK